PSVRSNRVDLPDSMRVEVTVGEDMFTETIPVNNQRGKFVLVGSYDFRAGQSATVTGKVLKTGDPLIGDAILMVARK
ncbi:MAG: hypothetical protein HRT61_22485, partial [Ekhidna sp.]|nr:hypothetical protein [Ekhidna sp.]